MSAGRVHLVVSCTNRKARAIEPELRMTSVPWENVDMALAAWLSRITAPTITRTPARTLYAGEHWQVVRQLEDDVVRGTPVSLWVCSGGYGLIDLDAPLVPYSATFSSGQPDTVGASREERQRWWVGLGAWDGPSPGRPRTFLDLAAREPDASILVAASPSYLSACSQDLLAAADKLSSPEKLSLISVGARHLGDLMRHVVPADARLQRVLGGTRQALNARLLGHLVRRHEGPPSTTGLTSTVRRLLSEAPPIERYERTPSSNDEIAVFVSRRLQDFPAATKSRLLREYRDSGRACEQTRFGTIFEEVKESGHAPR